MVRHGSEHLEATSWCPLTTWPRTSIEALSIGELPFDSRPSNARARRCNQTCRAADDPIAPDLAARRAQLRA